MQTILSIIKSELKQRLFSWVTVIFFLMLVFQAIWYTKGGFEYFANENVLMNAPSIIYRNYAAMGMLMIIIIAISTGGVLYKDIQYKSSEWTYAMPINEKEFFVGRFLAAFLYLVIISTGLILGHFLLPFSGIGEASQFGPQPWGQLFHGWLMFTVPNLFVYVALVFFSIVFSRRIATSYLAVFAVVITFLIAQTSYETGGGNNLLAYLLVDPGGYVAAQYYADLQSPLEKNTAYFQLNGYLLQNRLLWAGIALLLAVAAYFKFSFKYFIQAGVDKSKKIKEERSNLFSGATVRVPKIAKQFGIADFLKKLGTLSKLEFLNIVRPTSFKIILGIILLMVFLQNVTWNATYYIGKEVPISSNMTFFRLQWGVFVNMLIMIWAGELFFKDKTVNIWQITDSLPVPVWVTQLSRFVAVIGLSFVLSLSFIAISIFTQILLGGASYIDLARFAEDLLLYRWAFMNFVMYAALVFFVAGLTSNRIITHILSVGLFLFLVVSFDMGIVEDLRIGYGFVPGIEDFSEISSYGIFQTSANWFFLLWTSLAITLIMAGIWLWKRGSDKKWRHRLSLKNVQLAHTSKLAMVGCIGVFFFLMSFITKNVYDNGNFVPEDEQERLDAEYEYKYKHLEAYPQPKYLKVDLEIDLFPSERKATYEAEIVLANALDIDTLFLNWKDFVVITSLKLNQQELKPVKEDEDQNLTAYLIPKEAKGDSLLSVSIEGKKQYVGFVQGDFQGDLTRVGSFASIHEFLPVIGYDSDHELSENRTREALELTRLSSRIAEIGDPLAKGQDFFAPDAGLVTGSITISTETGQVPFAAGTLMKKEEREGRTIATYQIDDPSVFNWYLGSSDYALVQGVASGLDYTLFHKREHSFNIDLYRDAMDKGISYMQKQFGANAVPDKLQVLEIHRWQDPFYTFANTLVISEKEGWVADTKGLQEKAYLYLKIGSGLASLWLQKNVQVANVQGAQMLAEALPEAIGLQFVIEVFGEEAVQLLTEKKMEQYAKDRHNEPNQEPPLLYADGADYLEINKGATALSNLFIDIGQEQFIPIVLKWAASNTGKKVAFKSLYEILINNLSNKSREKWVKVFETTESGLL
ncbi:MAG: ABC transporter permease [Fulvivirga sp.]